MKSQSARERKVSKRYGALLRAVILAAIAALVGAALSGSATLAYSVRRCAAYSRRASSASSGVKEEKRAFAWAMYVVMTIAGVKPANCG